MLEIIDILKRELPKLAPFTKQGCVAHCKPFSVCCPLVYRILPKENMETVFAKKAFFLSDCAPWKFLQERFSLLKYVNCFRKCGSPSSICRRDHIAPCYFPKRVDNAKVTFLF